MCTCRILLHAEASSASCRRGAGSGTWSCTATDRPSRTSWKGARCSSAVQTSCVVPHHILGLFQGKCAPLRASGLPCRAYPASPTGVRATHSSLWVVLLAHQGHWRRMPYVLQRAPPGWRTQNDETAATTSNMAGSREVPAKRPTLHTRVNVGMRGPAYSLGSTNSTHLFAPATELRGACNGNRRSRRA